MARKTLIQKAKEIYIKSPSPLNARELARLVNAKSHGTIFAKMNKEDWETLRIEKQNKKIARELAKRKEQSKEHEEHTKEQEERKPNIIAMPEKQSPEQIMLDIYLNGKTALAGLSYKLVSKYLKKVDGDTTIDHDYKVAAIVQRMSQVYSTIFGNYIDNNIEEEDMEVKFGNYQQQEKEKA